MRSVLLAVLALLGALIVPRSGRAWTEARPAGMVTEYQVDRDGGATVTVRIQWRVLAGRLHQFDLAELPADLSLLEASATNAVGAPVPLSTRSPGPGRLEISLADAQGGVRRGTVDVVVRYTTSLRAQGLVRRAGTDAVLELSSPPWEHGLAAAEVRVALPSSARRAQWVADETAGIESTTTAEGSRDVVRLLRHRLPAATRWTVRVAADANLFPWLGSAAGHGPRVTRHRARPWGAAAGLGAALLAGMSLAARSVRRRGIRPIVPGRLYPALPLALGAAGCALQGLSLAGVSYALTLGTALVLAAATSLLPRRVGLRPAPVGDERPMPAKLVPRHDARARLYAVLRAAVAVALPVVLAYFAARTQRAALGVLAVDVAVLGLYLLAARAQQALDAETVTLAPIADALRARLKARRTEGLTLAWRLRGDDPAARGSVTLALQPRKGWSMPDDVLTASWAVETLPTTLGWQSRPTLRVRIRRGGHAEHTLRALAERVGAMQSGELGQTLVFVAALESDDVAPCLDALAGLLIGRMKPAPAAPAPRPAPPSQRATESVHMGQLLAQGGA